MESKTEAIKKSSIDDFMCELVIRLQKRGFRLDEAAVLAAISLAMMWAYRGRDLVEARYLMEALVGVFRHLEGGGENGLTDRQDGAEYERQAGRVVSSILEIVLSGKTGDEVTEIGDRAFDEALNLMRPNDSSAKDLLLQATLETKLEFEKSATEECRQE